MRMEKLTSKFQAALGDAQSLAVGRDHQFIEPVHLMLALLDQQGGSIRPLFNHAGINLNLLRSQLSEQLEKQARVEGANGELHISNALAKLFNVTDKLAQQRNDQFISSELFVLAAMNEKGPLFDVLLSSGARKDNIAKAVDAIRGGQSVDNANAEDQRLSLEKYTVDLTERAEQGKLDPVIGRDEEIRRRIQLLQRRTKNNPVPIGEACVGKPAIAEV